MASDAELFAHRDDADARAELVDRYDHLAQRLARKFMHRGIALDDLIQVARFGLVNAIDRFDIERGVRFSTFAGHTIVGEIKHHFRAHSWSIRVPRALQNLFLQTSNASQLLSQQLGRSPTVAEVAEYLDTDEDEVLEALDAGGSMVALSLDTPLGVGDTTPMIDTVGGVDQALQRAAQWAELAPVVASLDEREQTILYMRFYEGKTQREIGEEVGISQVHVSRILRRTIAHIRGEIVDSPS